MLLEIFTIGFHIVISLRHHKILIFCSKMIDRAIDLLDACRVTLTNHVFFGRLSPKVIRKILKIDPAAIGGPTDSKGLFFDSFSTSD